MKQMVDYFSRYFANGGYQAGSIAKFLPLYRDFFNISPGFAFYGFLSDIEFTCGSQAIATAAAQGFKSPIYLGYVNYDPSTPFPTVTPNISTPFAFHMWDYIAATEWWGFPRPGTGWSPKASDIAFGQVSLDAWYSLLVNGRIQNISGVSWDPVNSQGSRHIVTGFYNHTNPYPVNNVDWAVEKCRALASAPLLFDQKFWCVN